MSTDRTAGTGPSYSFDHLHLRSPDPDRTARWFETTFGAEVVRDRYPAGSLYPGAERITMRVGGQGILVAPPHPHLPTEAAPGFPRFGLEHIGLQVDDLERALADLGAKDVEVVTGPVTRPSGLRWAFVRGPEGTMVELLQHPVDTSGD